MWDASTIIDYLKGTARALDCQKIVDQAARGETRIIVPTLAYAEVAKLTGMPDDDAERRIREFFQRDYVVGAALDVLVGERARGLVRRYRLKPEDAVYFATALQLDVRSLETFDDDLLALDEREGDPPLTIERPTYRGTLPLFNELGIR